VWGPDPADHHRPLCLHTAPRAPGVSLEQLRLKRLQQHPERPNKMMQGSVGGDA